MTLNPADPAFETLLRQSFPEDLFRPVEQRYLEEPRGRYQGQAGVLALPRNTEQVAGLVRAAGAARVPIVPYGGGTGLVGGQVAPDGPAPLILSLERMAAIRAVYPQENVLIADAGCILADVQAAAQQNERLFPLSLAAEGSARIGGNLSSNAGGVNVLRYGNARDLCLGLEAVLPDGQIWNGLSRLRKDNTGYDLKNLLIGAEGTLGVITAASLKLSAIPASSGTAILVVSSPIAALELLSLARSRVGEGISAFELISGQGLDFLTEVLPHVRQPFAKPPEWCVLIELGLPAGLEATDAFAKIFEEALEGGLVSDGLIAQNQAQRDDFWNVREHLPEANRLVGAVASHDVSLPLGVIPEFLVKAPKALEGIGSFRINCFGHLGDGNLHYNVYPQAGTSRESLRHLSGSVSDTIHDLTDELGGSFSAEHGIGRLKVADLEKYGDPIKLATMRVIKKALDPMGVMNPGAVLAQ